MTDEQLSKAAEATDEEKPKKRRRRRTKAEIEADKALKEAEKLIKEQKEAEKKAQSKAADKEQASNIVVEQPDAPKEEKIQECSSKYSSDIEDSSKVEAKSSEEKLEEARQHVQNRFVGKIRVYEAPYEGSYAKTLFGAFTAVCLVNEFVQVEYVRRGFGLVKGYVLQKDFPC